jgi:hypothetical protein
MFKKISEMELDEEAYVVRTAIFAGPTGRLLISDQFRVASEPLGLRNVKIKKVTGMILVDARTFPRNIIAPRRLPFPKRGRVTYLSVKVVNPEKTVSEMADGDTGYVTYWALFKTHWWGPKYVSGFFIVHNEKTGRATLRIKRWGGEILIDRASLRNTSIDKRDVGYSGDNKFPARFSQF